MDLPQSITKQMNHGPNQTNSNAESSSEYDPEREYVEVVKNFRGESEQKIFKKTNKQLARHILEKDYEQFKNKLVSKDLEKISLPKRYSGFDIFQIEGKNETQTQIIERLRKYVLKISELEKLGTSLILSGKPGTGKTFLACSMIPAIVREIHNIPVEESDFYKNNMSLDDIKNPDVNICSYLNFYDFLLEIKSTYNSRSQDTEKNIFSKYANKRFLFLDEIGAVKNTDFDTSLIFRLINYRYEQMLPTVLISNLNIEDLKALIGERTVDRFKDNYGAVLSFEWQSLRK